MSALRSALPKTLRELRLVGCQQSPASAGVRAFIKSSYPAVKKANPELPILIREALGTPARAFARFERGVEKVVLLDGVSSAEEVEKKIAELIK
ncbi:thioredoxin-like protein [Leucosporidium creatinivorum]|uniref:Thioredoxin-like protein n=1 Tax=Leucosporidium creatinivorum TaxID=106004 RepID=A0A1Y2C3Y1_9BASI|nr:thioredoxin-like protein [Leucosporidium creatinivorum]